MVDLKIIGRTEKGILINPLTKKEYKGIPEIVKVNTEIIKIGREWVTLKILNHSKFKKEIYGIMKEPKGYEIFYSDLPNRLIVGIKIIQYVRFSY